MSDLPHLGELELAIMSYVWSRASEVTVPEVHRNVGRRRGLAYTTVMTVMGRLHAKGLLDRCEDARPYRYRPAMSREDYSAAMMVEVLEEFGERSAVLARFVERISARDAAALRRLVAGAKSRRR